MSLQLFIVIIIGIVVSIVVVCKIYRFFFVKKESGFCGGCKGCDFNPGHVQKTRKKKIPFRTASSLF